MKKKNIFILIILFIIIALGFVTCFIFFRKEPEIKENNVVNNYDKKEEKQLIETKEDLFEFEETENGLAVTLYKDSEANIYNIPSEHEGKKVVEIAYPGFGGGLTHMVEVNIPDTIESICENAFSNNENLVKVYIGNSVKEISNHAFFRCKSIENVTIPDSVESIGEATFGYCESLKKVIIGAKLKVLPATAFASTGIEEITIPPSVTEIGIGCFFQCYDLKKIVIPSSVTKIDKTAFQADTSSSANLPDLVIYCEKGSYAETFAKENSIKFVAE